MNYILVGSVFPLLVIGTYMVWELREQNTAVMAVTTAYNDSKVEGGFTTELGSTTVSIPVYRVGQGLNYTLEELREWQRPDGPVRVGVQVGHLNNDKMPDELAGLSRNGAGAVFGQYNERDTVQVIAELVADQLRQSGILVDILPATVPPRYVADAFVSIHADGNQNTAVRGFKIAGPRRDYSGRSEALVRAINKSYGDVTGLPIDPSVSSRMTVYYAFNWPRFEHTVHPYTPAAIVETGFLTNAADRAFLLENPERSAAGITAGILQYRQNIPLPNPPPQRLVAPSFPLTGIVQCAEVRAERRNRTNVNHVCTPSITVEGVSYLLAPLDDVATSSFPYQATVTGTYQPIQTLDN